jgi:hypothetical protein
MNRKTSSTYYRLSYKSLHTLPVELVYRILDYLNEFDIICSMQNVCVRINLVVDSYYRHQVKFFIYLIVRFSLSSKSIYSCHISYFCNVFFCSSQTVRSNRVNLISCCTPGRPAPPKKISVEG